MVHRDYVSYQCSRRGVNTEDEKLWCKQHTPSLVKARSEASYQKYTDDMERRNAIISTERKLTIAVLHAEISDLPPEVAEAVRKYRAAR
jgi:hypothetical protein